MNPSYIFLPLLTLLLASVLLLIYYRMALRFALQAIDPQRMNYGAVLRQEMERNQLDPDRMDVKYDKLFLVNQRGQELTARLYLTPSQTDRYILFLHGYNYPWIGVLKYLPMLLRLGFNVLVPDLQAQGESRAATSPLAHWKVTTHWSGWRKSNGTPSPWDLTAHALA